MRRTVSDNHLRQGQGEGSLRQACRWVAHNRVRQQVVTMLAGFPHTTQLSDALHASCSASGDNSSVRHT